MPDKPLIFFLSEKIKSVNRRLLFAMVCYLVLLSLSLYVVLPVQTKEERYLLGFVLFVFAMLIFRTLLHAAKGDLAHARSSRYMDHGSLIKACMSDQELTGFICMLSACITNHSQSDTGGCVCAGRQSCIAGYSGIHMTRRAVLRKRRH